MSIAAQLRVLAGSDKKIEANNRRKASFLFEPRVASDTDAQTIFNLSRNGLTELIKLNNAFSAFENTLFARVPESSYLMNMTPDVKKKLDQSISFFLRLLSPYFLNKAAHKCVEFLIRCYSVHERNVEALIACVLPYHETALFPRMLRIINLSNYPIFTFLETCKKNNCALARATLVQRCINDYGLLSYIIDYSKPTGTKALQQHIIATSDVRINYTNYIDKTFISFVTVLLIDMLCTIEKLNDQLLGHYISYILAQILSKQGEHQLSGYMVLTHACTLTKLKLPIFNELFTALCTTLYTSNSNDPTNSKKIIQYGLLCIVSLCTSQSNLLVSTSNASANGKDIYILPNDAFLALLNIPDFVDYIVIIASKYNITTFLWAYIHSVIVNMCIPVYNTSTNMIEYQINTPCVVTLLAIIEKLSLVTNFSYIMKWLLDSFITPLTSTYCTNNKTSVYNEYISTLRKFFVLLDTKYPSLTLTSISDIFTYICNLDTMDTKVYNNIHYLQHVITNTKLTNMYEYKDVFVTEYTRITSDNYKSIVLSIFTDIFANTRHEILGDKNVSLMLAFTHNNEQVRIEALDRIDTLLMDIEEKQQEQEDAKLASEDDDDEKMNDSDDELNFLSSSLVVDTAANTDDSAAMKPTSASGTSTKDAQVEEASTLGLQGEVADLLEERVSNETNIHVLSKVLTLRVLHNTKLISQDTLTNFLLVLFERCMRVYTLHKNNIGKLTTGDISIHPTDTTHIHNYYGCSVLLKALFEFTNEYIIANYTTMDTSIVNKLLSYYLTCIYMNETINTHFIKNIPFILEQLRSISSKTELKYFKNLSLKAYTFDKYVNNASMNEYNMLVTKQLSGAFTSIESLDILKYLLFTNTSTSSSSTISTYNTLLHKCIFLILQNMLDGKANLSLQIEVINMILYVSNHIYITSIVLDGETRVILQNLVLSVLTCLNNYKIKETISYTDLNVTVNHAFTSIYTFNILDGFTSTNTYGKTGKIIALHDYLEILIKIYVLSSTIMNLDSEFYTQYNTHISNVNLIFILQSILSYSYYDITDYNIFQNTKNVHTLLETFFTYSIEYISKYVTGGSNTTNSDSSSTIDEDVSVYYSVITLYYYLLTCPIATIRNTIISTISNIKTCNVPVICKFIDNILVHKESILIDNTFAYKLYNTILGSSEYDTLITMTPALTLTDKETTAYLQYLCNDVKKVTSNVSSNYIFYISSVIQMLPPIVYTQAKSSITKEILSVMKYFDALKITEDSATTTIGVDVSDVTGTSTSAIKLQTNLNIISMRRFLQVVCKHVCTIDDSMLSMFISFMINYLKYDYTFVSTSTSTITCSYRDIVLPYIASDYFRCLQKTVQSELFDTLVQLMLYVPPVITSTNMYVSPYAYTPITTSAIMNIFYNAKLSSNLFVKYFTASKKHTTSQNLTVVEYTLTLHVSKILNLLYMQTTSTCYVKKPIRLLPHLFTLLHIMNKYYDSLTKDMNTTGLDEHITEELAHMHVLYTELYTNVAHIINTDRKLAIAEFTTSEIDCIMFICKKILSYNTTTSSTSANGTSTVNDTSVLAANTTTNTNTTLQAQQIVNISLQDPQVALARDIILQCISYIACTNADLIIPHILDITTLLISSICVEEKTATFLRQPSPSLALSVASPICTSINVIQGSYLDITIRAFRSIIGPVLAYNTSRELYTSNGITYASILRILGDLATSLHANTIQILTSAAVRYITLGTFNVPMRNSNSSSNGNGNNEDDEDNMNDHDDDDDYEDESDPIWYTVPIDISTETELDALVPCELISGAICVLLARAYLPKHLSLITPSVLDKTDSNNIHYSNGILTVELVDTCQRILMNYAPDVQVSVLTSIIPNIYVYSNNTDGTITNSSSSSSNAPVAPPVRKGRGKAATTTTTTTTETTTSVISSMNNNIDYYLLADTFAESNIKYLYTYQLGTLQFLNTIASSKEFRTNIIGLSRSATQSYVQDPTNSSMSSEEAEHTLQILGDAFIACFSRLFTSIHYCETLRGILPDTHVYISHWRSMVQSTDTIIHSLLSLLTTHHFSSVFKSIFKFSLDNDDILAKELLCLYLNNAKDQVIITRKVAVKKLLMLLIDRLHIERERIHAESFIHVINSSINDSSNTNSNSNTSTPQDDFIENITVDNTNGDLEDDEILDVRKKLWIQQLRYREHALLSVIPSLSTQLFYPFLNYYKQLDSKQAKQHEKDIVYGEYNPEEDLENLQVAMLCIDELSDIACLLLSPMSSPAAAMAALSGVGSKRPVVQLPKNVLEMLLEVYGFVLKVSTLSATHTFTNTSNNNGDNITWSTLLSSSLLCMSTLATRTGIQSLMYLNKLAPLSLAVLDKVCNIDGGNTSADDDDNNNAQEEEKKMIEERIVTGKKSKKTITKSTTVATPATTTTFTLPTEQSDVLKLSALSVIDTLLRSSSQFLAPYLPHILSVVLHEKLPENNPISSVDLRFSNALASYSTKSGDSDANVNNKGTESNQHASFVASGGLVSSCLQALANYVSPRVLLPAIYSTWSIVVTRGSISACRLLALLAKVCITLNSISDEYTKKVTRNKRKNKKSSTMGDTDVDDAHFDDDDDEDNEEDDEANNFDEVDDDFIDFSDNEERNISNYVNSLSNFFFTVIALRKQQANPESEIFSEEQYNTVSFKPAPGTMSFEWSTDSIDKTNTTTNSVKTSHLWSDAALQAVENALENAFMQYIYKIDEIQLKHTFTSLVDWVGFHDKLPAYKEDKHAITNLIMEHLPSLIPFYRLTYGLMSNLRHIFLPYILDIFDDILVILQDHGKMDKEEKAKLKEITKKNGKRMLSDDMIANLDTQDAAFVRRHYAMNVWRVMNSIWVVKTVHSALQSDTIMARGSFGQTTAIIAKADMERLIPAIAGHIEVAFAIRTNLPSNASNINILLNYPEFIDQCLNPCLGQLSVHLAYSNPVYWDILAQSTLVQSKHASPMVRFAVLSALHLYIKRNTEDFLLLLPKIITYISEFMQDTNILVEKLAQDVIKTIEKLSGESLRDYLEN